jgi:hypothetical protein
VGPSGDADELCGTVKVSEGGRDEAIRNEALTRLVLNG